MAVWSVRSLTEEVPAGTRTLSRCSSITSASGCELHSSKINLLNNKQTNKQKKNEVKIIWLQRNTRYSPRLHSHSLREDRHHIFVILHHWCVFPLFYKKVCMVWEWVRGNCYCCYKSICEVSSLLDIQASTLSGVIAKWTCLWTTATQPWSVRPL